MKETSTFLPDFVKNFDVFQVDSEAASDGLRVAGVTLGAAADRAVGMCPAQEEGGEEKEV